MEREILGSMGVLFALTISAASMAQTDSPAAESIAADSQPATGASSEVSSTIPVAQPAATSTVPVESASRTSNRTIEEIVVTAQKREESIQTVPISIAAFSADALDARGAFDTKALVTLTPAVSETEFGGFSFIYIRGVGSDAFVPSADPSVTTYVDGIFVPTSQGFSTDFGGIKRVEVLKGPQGTLFGRNSTGGAISVITKKPGEQLEGNIDAELGNFDEQRLKGYFNVPVTDTFGVAADLLYKHLDSQYTEYNRDILPTKNFAGRFRADWHPTEWFDLDLSYFRSQQQTAGSLVSKNIEPSLAFMAIIPRQEDDYTAEQDFDTYVKGYSYVYAANSTVNLPWFDIRLIGADQKTNSTYSSIDFDGSKLPIVNFYTKGQFSEAKTAELQFLSRPDALNGDVFEWVAGSYYLRGSGGFDQIYLEPGNDLGPVVLGLAGVPTQLTGLFDPVTQLANAQLKASGIVAIKSISGYAQGTYHATDWLALTLGGRYQDENRYLTQAYTDAYYPATQTQVPVLNFRLQGKKADNFSSRTAISVTPEAGKLLYVSRSQGFKSGTYNVINIYEPPSYVKPELVTSYELGTKLDFFGGLLRVNSAIFENDITNKQVSFVSLLSGGAVQLGNAHKTRIRGGEFDIAVVPLPDLDSGLAITANGAYLTGKYLDYPNGQGYTETTGTYQGTKDFTGNKVERTPKFSGGLGLVQTLDVSENGQFEVGGDVYYNSGFYFSPDNAANLKQDAYTLVNFRTSYLYRPWNLRLTGFIRNVFNEEYHIGKFQTDFGILSTRAYPAQWGLMASYSF